MAGNVTSDFTVYIDGACKRNGKTGSRAAYGFYIENDRTKCNGLIDVNEKQTNNTGELVAAIEALNYALSKNIQEIVIKSDSEYVIRGITKDILFWKNNDWKLKSTNALVKNKGLWEKLYSLSTKLNVKWIHVRRESEKGQTIADQLARDAYEEPVKNSDIIMDGEKEDSSENRMNAYVVESSAGELANKEVEEEEETLVKCVVDQDRCLMCDNNSNKAMIRCQICNCMVHFICSLLPGYYLSLVEEGKIKFICYNCSNDEGKFKDKNFIDKIYIQNEELKHNLKKSYDKVDTLSDQISKVQDENGNLKNRLQEIENSQRRRLNELRANETVSHEQLLEQKSEFEHLKSKYEATVEENRKREKTLKDMTREMKNKESQLREYSDKMKTLTEEKETDKRHIENLRKLTTELETCKSNILNQNASSIEVIDALQSKLDTYENLSRTNCLRKESETYADVVRVKKTNATGIKNSPEKPTISSYTEKRTVTKKMLTLKTF